MRGAAAKALSLTTVSVCRSSRLATISCAGIVLPRNTLRSVWSITHLRWAKASPSFTRGQPRANSTSMDGDKMGDSRPLRLCHARLWRRFFKNQTPAAAQRIA